MVVLLGKRVIGRGVIGRGVIGRDCDVEKGV